MCNDVYSSGLNDLRVGLIFLFLCIYIFLIAIYGSSCFDESFLCIIIKIILEELVSGYIIETKVCLSLSSEL